MADYDGMRWFKCDLQMQTPADAQNWRGPRMGDSDSDREAAAEAYIRRCYEVGLEVVAITDHNFLSQRFIPLLQASIRRLSGEFGYKIVLFPGFEFEANVGKGVHVLGLFEPTADLTKVDHVLTECGVPYPRHSNGRLAKSQQPLADVIERIQRIENGLQQGLVVLPHAFGDAGIFDDERIPRWLQQTEFLNQNLLAVEVPKPVHELSAGLQRLLRAGDDCHRDWRRERPVACLTSSDAKALTEKEDRDNYIGKRFTWIKMSSPSLEALRQAFLDHESRIRLQPERPTDSEHHPRFIQLSVQGAKFLDNQTVCFSSNLNCLIGGRGSGKSSLLEYLRFCIQPDYASGLDSDSRDKLERIRNTVSETSSSLLVEFEVAPGLRDVVELRPYANDHRLTTRDEVHDLRTVLDQLQVQFFSQGELTRLTRPGQNPVVRLIDASCADALSELNTQEEAIRGKLQQLFSARHQERLLKGELQRLKQSVQELSRQWQARVDIQEVARIDRQAQDAKAYRRRTRELTELAATQLRNAISALEPIEDLPDGAEHWPHVEVFANLREESRRAYERLIEEVGASIERFEASCTLAATGDRWTEVLDDLQEAEQRFFEACEAKGVRPEEAKNLQDLDQQRRAAEQRAQTKERELATLGQQTAGLDAALNELHSVWRSQFSKRREACEAMRNSTTRIEICYMQDPATFRSAWNRLAPRDLRFRLGKSWDEIGNSLFHAFREDTTADSPWEVLSQWLSQPARIPADSAAASLATELAQHLQADDMRAIWENIRLTRVDDWIDVELLRPDRSSAGWLSGKEGNVLSEGQRNTALLSIILAQGRGPIVIDQPEDELDSNYIYSDLVPLLRRAKNGRQLILATHNANLPVNADAELIYALDAQGARGRRRTQGGLDRPDVTKAVLDIMEGSERAFKQRREKYRF